MPRAPKPVGPDLPLPAADTHSEGFRHTRQARRNALQEDYVELIAALMADGGEARQVDIAQRLGVAQPTVAKAIHRLIAEGLVVKRPYRGVFLTPAGERVAKASHARHETVESFLKALGVDPDTARIDAEGIEHHVSEQTLRAFRRFLEATSAAKPD